MRPGSAAPNFDFMGGRRVALVVSVLLMVGSIAAIALRGLNLGIDFTGGVMLEFAYADAANLEEIRTSMEGLGFAEVEVQNFGSDSEVLIRIPPLAAGVETEDIGADIQRALRESDSSATLQRAEIVDAEVGDDLTEQGGLAMLFALILIFGYVMLRFRWKFAAGAIAALVHDVVFTIGFFAVTGITFDLSTLAAILAVIGYSLNDTIVVYDRIRENFRVIRRGSPVDVVNTSINQTLSRTLITGLTTLLVLAALLVLGGEAVATFSIALIVGVIIGTYSSIYVASAAALLLDVSQQDLIPVKVDEVDSMP
ncbi:MAG TPA: protein translocase subunit SecF [Gammaproteobacteria bacterium]|nr:protein translocase subunit SecF [Gammaproteobacteria bacterium]